MTDAVTTNAAAGDTTPAGAQDTDSTTTNPVATPGLQPTSAPIVATKHKAKVTSGGSH